MSKTVKLIKKLAVASIGFPLLILGIILVPLPGPGLLVMFAALLILSTEFDWAGRYAQTARQKLKAIYDKAKERADKIDHS